MNGQHFIYTNGCITFIGVILIVLIKNSDCQCASFTNTTVILTVNKTETTEVLNECLENHPADKVIIKTCLEKLDRGTFKNMPNLQELQLVGLNIRRIEPDFAENVPKLKYLTITHNPMQEILRGVVWYAEIDFISFEDNRIERIQKYAFQKVRAEVLSLNNNSLRSIEKDWFKDSSINNLQVASNKLTWISRDSFAEIKNLEYLDLPDNNIFYVQDGAFSALKLLQLDLSENMLTQINFLTNMKVDYLQLGVNMFNYVFLDNTTSVKTISVYPNPWRCECLRKFWSVASTKEITLKDPPAYLGWKDELPVCIAQGTECAEYDKGDIARKDYFKSVSYSKLQYSSIFD